MNSVFFQYHYSLSASIIQLATMDLDTQTSKQTKFIFFEAKIVYYDIVYIKLKVKWSHSVMSDSLWPMDCSLPGSSVHGIFQARILEWVAISFSRGSSQPRDRTWVSCIAGGFFRREASAMLKVKVKSLNRVQLFVTPWTVAYQTPLSMGFSRQYYWSGWPFPSPADLPDPRIEPRSPAL